jgi:hypothetical protein
MLSTFNASTPWVVEAQKLVAGEFASNVSFNDQWEAFTPPSGNFSHAKPNITDDEGIYTINSYSHQRYNWRTDSRIDAADFYAASEVGAKLKSRAAIYDYFNQTMKVNESSCQEINQFAYKWVRENWKGN